MVTNLIFSTIKSFYYIINIAVSQFFIRYLVKPKLELNFSMVFFPPAQSQSFNSNELAKPRVRRYCMQL